MIPLTDIKLFLLDLDGTMYIDGKPIEGACEFLDTLTRQGKDYVFLTNNSSRNADDYVKRVSAAGFPCKRSNIFTSGMAAGLMLQNEKQGKSVYVCGTRSLVSEIKSYGINVTEDDADIVLLGYDTELTYEKISAVCRMLDGGAEYFATNVDMVCPIENGRFLPDCGSMANMLEEAVHRRPIFIGKPEKTLVDIIEKEKQIGRESIAIVGDRLYTDIATGINAGITSVLVLSGETDSQAAAASSVKADYTFDSVKDLYLTLI